MKEVFLGLFLGVMVASVTELVFDVRENASLARKIISQRDFILGKQQFSCQLVHQLFEARPLGK